MNGLCGYPSHELLRGLKAASFKAYSVIQRAQSINAELNLNGEVGEGRMNDGNVFQTL